MSEREPVPRKVYLEVFKKDGGKCQGCGGTYYLQVDHILAVVNGGSNDLDNLQLLCRECHAEKTKWDINLSKNLTLVEWNEIGKNLQYLNDSIDDVIYLLQIKLNKHNRYEITARKMHELLTKLRRDIDDEIFKEYPNESVATLGAVCYGGR